MTTPRRRPPAAYDQDVPMTSTLREAGPEVSVAPGAEDLLILAHRAAAARAQARLDGVVALARDDLAGSLDALLPLDDARRRDWSVWFALWSVADTCPDLAGEHRRFLATMFTDLRRIAVAAHRTQQLPVGVDAEAWTRQALVALHEVAVAALLAPESWPSDRQRAEVARLVRLDPPRADDLVGHGATVLQDRDAAVRDGFDPAP
jgi:hypothetical protein